MSTDRSIHRPRKKHAKRPKSTCRTGRTTHKLIAPPRLKKKQDKYPAGTTPVKYVCKGRDHQKTVSTQKKEDAQEQILQAAVRREGAAVVEVQAGNLREQLPWGAQKLTRGIKGGKWAKTRQRTGPKLTNTQIRRSVMADDRWGGFFIVGRTRRGWAVFSALRKLRHIQNENWHQKKKKTR